jgi:apolipoprotein N-acyltransferase
MMPLVLAFLAGLTGALGFEPVGLWPLTIFAFAGLIWLVERAPSLRSALARGWWFGVGQFVLGLNWIATAFTYQSNMPAWLGWIAVLLLSFYLAVYPAAAAGLAWRWAGANRLKLVLILAAAWIVTEYLRAVLFTGFAWNPIGVSLLPTPLSLFAALSGTYGLSGLAVLIAGALYLLARRGWKQGGALAAAIAALVASAWIATQGPAGETGPAIRIVQPNVGQGQKHEEGYGPQLRRFREASTKASDEPRLLLWPEDGVPFLLDEEPYEARMIGEWLGEGDLLLTGGFKIERDEAGRPLGARNSVWAIDPDGRLLGRYDKAHLVPYGEYLPMRSLLEPIGLSQLVPGTLDTWEGPGPKTLNLPGFGRVGLQICYEIVFSGQVVDRRDRPDFIFNPSNDAWFGRWGPPQHFAQARLRALEEGLPVLRSTPTGISGVIDARGRVMASIPWNEPGLIDARLPPPAPATLFARFGNLLPFAFALLLVAAAVAVGRKTR